MPSLNSTRGPRTMRMHETREAEQRPNEYDYSPPALLELPPARAGFALRWVREYADASAIDRNNLDKKRREGYQPAAVADYPQFAPEADPDGRIRRGGIILMEIPIERAQARERYYRTQAQRQVEAADVMQGFRPANGTRLPVFDRTERAELTVGGRRAG